MKLQPITYKKHTGEQYIEFVRADREPNEEPEVVVQVSTPDEYDEVAKNNEIIRDARYWVQDKAGKLEYDEVASWSSELADKIATRLDMTNKGFVETRDYIEAMLRSFLQEQIKAIDEE